MHLAFKFVARNALNKRASVFVFQAAYFGLVLLGRLLRRAPSIVALSPDYTCPAERRSWAAWTPSDQQLLKDWFSAKYSIVSSQTSIGQPHDVFSQTAIS